MESAGGFQVGGRAGGVVIGRRLGVAEMADDEDFLLAFAGDGGGDDFDLAIVEAGVYFDADFHQGGIVAGRLKADLAAKFCALAWGEDEAETLFFFGPA